jgi:hypothetical protein
VGACGHERGLVGGGAGPARGQGAALGGRGGARGDWGGWRSKEARQGLIMCSCLSCPDEFAMCPWDSRPSQLRWWRTPTSRFRGGMWGAASGSTAMTLNYGRHCSCCLGWASPSSSRCSPTCRRPAFRASSSGSGKLPFVCLSSALSSASAVLNSEDALY